ncbi:MAG: cysteine peptidase family C39 domain-containing protein [Candidatus Moduliflexus flocculans]|nr:cysteine peptidase family C39 domain-containing protein [Candidatus Moduliflexus flocculans]
MPDVRQSTGYTCGAAALQAVLAYWGMSEREDRLAARLRSTPEAGTHPDDIVRVAREFGLTAELREGLDLSDLESALAAGTTVIVDLQAWRENTDRPLDRDLGRRPLHGPPVDGRREPLLRGPLPARAPRRHPAGRVRRPLARLRGRSAPRPDATASTSAWPCSSVADKPRPSPLPAARRAGVLAYIPPGAAAHPHSPRPRPGALSGRGHGRGWTFPPFTPSGYGRSAGLVYDRVVERDRRAPSSAPRSARDERIGKRAHDAREQERQEDRRREPGGHRAARPLPCRRAAPRQRADQGHLPRRRAHRHRPRSSRSAPRSA